MKRKYRKMKTKVRFLKIAVAMLLVVVTLFTLAACGAKEPVANDAEGTAGNLKWRFVKDTKTLTIEGAGEMPANATSNDVSWSSVRSSVEKVAFVGVEGNGVTTISDYAFYYMPKLKEITIPASVTSIGKNAFAFCTSLESIVVPEGVVSVGEGAFEACSALKSAELSTTVTSIGKGAFAYCSALTDVKILGNAGELPENTFRNCKALANISINSAVTASENAFRDAAVGNLDGAQRVSDRGTLTVKYVYEDGTQADETKVFEAARGDRFNGGKIETKAIDGYTPDILNLDVVCVGIDDTRVVTYKKNQPAPEETAAPETEAPKETEAPADDDGKVGVGTYIAIGILVVVVLAIAVGAFLLLRSDKKDKAKNAGNKGAKNSNNNNKKK